MGLHLSRRLNDIYRRPATKPSRESGPPVIGFRRTGDASIDTVQNIAEASTSPGRTGTPLFRTFAFVIEPHRARGHNTTHRFLRPSSTGSNLFSHRPLLQCTRSSCTAKTLACSRGSKLASGPTHSVRNALPSAAGGFADAALLLLWSPRRGELTASIIFLQAGIRQSRFQRMAGAEAPYSCLPLCLERPKSRQWVRRTAPAEANTSSCGTRPRGATEATP